MTTIDSFIRLAADAPGIDPALGIGPGTTIGDYQVVERIGSGGMATVYRAYARRLDRDVAIKVPRLRLGVTEHVHAMFVREARTTARLTHPNIVTVHDLGEHAGAPYVVLELLRGETLATRLAREGALPLDVALDIVGQILRALAFAHAAGVVHRDLTPRNVFIGTDGVVKVLDFGVALHVHDMPGTVTRGAGTPGYKAPQHDLVHDPRNDLWSVAVILFECLAGHRPRAVDDALPAETPPYLRTLVRRALSEALEDRPSGAAQMLAALRPSPAPPARGRRWALGGALAVIACVLGLVMLSSAEAAHTALPRDGRWRGDPGGGTSWETRLERIDAQHFAYENHDRVSGRTARGTLEVQQLSDGSTVLAGRTADVPNCPTCTNVGYIEFIVLDDKTIYQNRAAWGPSHDHYVEWFPPYRYKWLGTVASAGNGT